ncbi:MAG TPA: NAD(P)/FAD-dependent oxidoreductase [Actinomycetes bacterium]|jgi:phytoene dehydrogenase-like protein
MPNADPWDAVVVGGGHNGLVAAAYLARAGARTLVCEARHKTGGAATTDAPWPDAPEIRVTRLSYVMSLMPPSIIRDLDLVRHGYKVHPMGPYYQAWPDGRSLKIHADDAARNHDEIARFSKRDADAMPRWDAWLGGIADVLAPLLMQPPPRLGSTSWPDLRDTLRLAWRYRGLGVRTVADVTRLLTMSITDLLDDWFESEQVKASLAINGVIGTWAGPDEPGTAYVMAHHSIGDVGDGHMGSWGFPEGGMGAVADAIRAAAEAAGATVRTGAPVEHVIVEGGQARGVVLAGGEEVRAPVVVSAVHPRRTFLEQVDRAELPAEFVADVERWRSRSGVVKVNLALAELPDFSADPGSQPQEHHSGAIELALSPAYVEQAFQDAKAGRGAERPFVDGCIPSVLDPTLCPDGVHVMSLFAQWCPHEWSEAPHHEELEAFADRVVAGYAELAPNLPGAILHREVIGPWQMEQEYGLVGGNIFHGELSLEQLFHQRPAPGYADYRSPVRGLYQASSATHGGGGVCGIPGHHAARAVIADRRRGRGRRRR